MAQWHYDVTGAEPILRDIPVYAAAALAKGQVMCSGPVATEVNDGRAIAADDDVLSNIIGVLNEDVTAANALAVLATGVENFAKIIINPFAVWLTKYDTSATYAITETAGSATGLVLTAADLGDNNQAGFWGYVRSGTGAGNLICGASPTAATSMNACSTLQGTLKSVAIGDTFCQLYPRYTATVVGGNVDLASTAAAGSLLKPQNATSGAGAALVLENYVQTDNRPMEMLKISRHNGINLASENNVQFYGDVFFAEHLLSAGGTVCNRVIN